MTHFYISLVHSLPFSFSFSFTYILPLFIPSPLLPLSIQVNPSTSHSIHLFPLKSTSNSLASSSLFLFFPLILLPFLSCLFFLLSLVFLPSPSFFRFSSAFPSSFSPSLPFSSSFFFSFLSPFFFSSPVPYNFFSPFSFFLLSLFLIQANCSCSLAHHFSFIIHA